MADRWDRNQKTTKSEGHPKSFKKWEPLNPKSKTSIHRLKRTIHPLTAQKKEKNNYEQETDSYGSRIRIGCNHFSIRTR